MDNDGNENEKIISPIDPYTAFRLMGQTRRALWALKHNNPARAFEILQRQLQDCEQAVAEMERYSENSLKP